MSTENFSDMIEPALNSWFHLFKHVPEYPLAVSMYLGCGALIALLWWRIARRLPRLLGGFLWLLVFALIFSPTITEGANAQIAPAIVGVLLNVKPFNAAGLLSNLLPILLVMGIGCIVAFVLNKMRYAEQA